MLLALFLGQFGSGVYDLVFSNFLRDAQHLDVEMRGFIELPRELPGILSLFVVGMLFMFNEVRMAGVACLLMFGGMYALALCGPGTGLWVLSAWILTVSLGQHVLMGMIDTIVIHTARPENRSLRLGQMKALGTAASLLGALCVWIKWKFNQSFAVDFFIMGGVCLLAAVLLSRVKTPVFPKRRGWRECFVFKRRYTVYYGLEILHGIRKQLYLTFGFWLMVSTLGQSPEHIGKTLLIAGVVGLGTQPLIGWSIKRFGERNVTIFDSIALSLLCLAYAFAPGLLPSHWAVAVVTTCFVLDNLLFALGMARSTYVARICERPEEITPSIYTGLAINHVASISYGVLGGLIWMSFRVADDPVLRGHVNAETRTSPAYPAGDTEHTYTVYHDPLPLTVEDLVGETVYKDYSCYREIQGSPLLTAYKYRQEGPYVFDIVSEEDGPELLYEIYEVKLDCLYEPVKQSFFKDKTFSIPGKFKFTVSQNWTPVDAAPWGALDAYRFIREDNTPIGNFLLCYADRFVEIRFDPWYDGAAPTEKQMALVGTVLGSGPLS